MMTTFTEAMLHISPIQEPEVMEGYQRYEVLLAEILTPEQLQTYVDYIERVGELRIFAEMTPEELAALSPEESAVATTVLAHEFVSLENRRVASLLNQQGDHEAAPDMNWVNPGKQEPAEPQ